MYNLCFMYDVYVYVCKGPTKPCPGLPTVFKIRPWWQLHVAWILHKGFSNLNKCYVEKYIHVPTFPTAILELFVWY